MPKSYTTLFNIILIKHVSISLPSLLQCGILIGSVMYGYRRGWSKSGCKTDRKIQGGLKGGIVSLKNWS